MLVILSKAKDLLFAGSATDLDLEQMLLNHNAAPKARPQRI